MRRQSLLLLATTLSLAGCGDVIMSPDLFPIATAYRTCGPGFPAVAIELSPDVAASARPPYPQVRVTIWRGIGEIAERTYPLSSNSRDGFSVSLVLPTEPLSSIEPLRGSLDIRRVERDSTITGYLDVRFTDGSRFARPFSARWQPRPVPTCL
jgi:hypothetical protein